MCDIEFIEIDVKIAIQATNTHTHTRSHELIIFVAIVENAHCVPCSFLLLVNGIRALRQSNELEPHEGIFLYLRDGFFSLFANRPIKWTEVMKRSNLSGHEFYYTCT